MAKAKKLSGAARKRRIKQGIKPNPIGRPRGSIKALLHFDLVHKLWEKGGFPHHPYGRFTVDLLLSRHGDFAPERLIPLLREHRPEYGEDRINDETLCRYFGEQLRIIWGPRRRR
jgi:hypothetical protein